MTGQVPMVDTQVPTGSGPGASAFPSRRQMRAAMSYQDDMSFQPEQPATSAPLPSRRSRDNTLPDTAATPVARPQTIIRPPSHTGSIRAVTATGELSRPRPTDGAGSVIPPALNQPGAGRDMVARPAVVRPPSLGAEGEPSASAPRVARRSAVEQPGEALDPTGWSAGEIPSSSLPTVLSEVAELLSGERYGAGTPSAAVRQPLGGERPPQVGPSVRNVAPVRNEAPVRKEAPVGHDVPIRVSSSRSASDFPRVEPQAPAEADVAEEVAEETSIRDQQRAPARQATPARPQESADAVPSPPVPTRRSSVRRTDSDGESGPRVIDPMSGTPSWQEAAFGEKTDEEPLDVAEPATRRREQSEPPRKRSVLGRVLFVLLVFVVFFVLGVVAWLLTGQGNNRGAAMVPSATWSEGYSKYIDLLPVP